MGQINPEQKTKVCAGCSTEKEVERFRKDPRYKDGYAGHCRDCGNKRKDKWRKRHPEEVKASDRRNKARPEYKAQRRVTRRKYAVEHPEVSLLDGARDRAKRYGLPLDITLDDIVVPDVCPVLGLQLIRGNGMAQPNSPSLDRIIPERGYVKGNIIVVSHMANTIKNNATVDQLRKVADFYESLS
jgi:hypothetical protein